MASTQRLAYAVVHLRTRVILLIACAIPVTCANAQFVWPVEGTAYVDWSITHYVDLDPGPGTLDYLGGAHTYDGHKGIDLSIAGFAAMDTGVDIYAASAGVVYDLYDDHFDHCTALALCGHHENNFITIEHGNGLVTQYLHLKTNSATVEIGQFVQAGMKIGEVGSSRRSSWPLLHFEVYENGNAIETFLGSERWWDGLPLYALDVPNITSTTRGPLTSNWNTSPARNVATIIPMAQRLQSGRRPMRFTSHIPMIVRITFPPKTGTVCFITALLSEKPAF